MLLKPPRLDQQFTFPANAPLLKEVRGLTETIEGRLGMIEGAEAGLRQSLLEATNALFDATGAAIVPAIGGILRMQERGFMTAHSSDEVQLTTNWPVEITITDDAERVGWVASPFIALTRDVDVADYAIVRTDSYNHETGVYFGQIVQAFGPHQGTEFSDWTLTGLPGAVIAEQKMWSETMVAAQQVAADRVAVLAARDIAVAYGADAELAHQWATKPTTPVAGGEYSAYYWAQAAQTAAGFVDGSAYTAINGSRPFTGKQAFRTPVVGSASLTLPPGVTPTTLVNGDVWTETGGFFARINGATRRLVQDNDITGFQATSQKGAANGYAGLDAGVKLPVALLPTTGAPYELTTARGAANGYAPLGADSKVPAANLNIPAAPVQSVASLTGSITAAGLRTALGIDALDNTSDPLKPISIATANGARFEVEYHPRCDGGGWELHLGPRRSRAACGVVERQRPDLDHPNECDGGVPAVDANRHLAGGGGHPRHCAGGRRDAQ